MRACFKLNNHRQLCRWLFLFLISISLFNPCGISAKENGKFILTFEMPKEEVYRNIAIIYKSSDQFQSIIDGINKELILPRNIKVEFANKEGPIYNPNTHTITMSYDYIFYLTELYLNKYPKASSDEMILFSIRSSTFLFYHEIAHALIDVCQLPIVSNEETAADNLAIILALEYTNDGYDVAMDSANLFNLLDENSKEYQEDDLWDEHALNSQRFYNILCLTYGKYPDKMMSELKKFKNKKLLQFIHEKSSYCVEEYNQQLQSWLKLLEPYFAP